MHELWCVIHMLITSCRLPVDRFCAVDVSGVLRSRLRNFKRIV